MKKRKPQRSKNKALKKKKNQQQQQARLLRKLQREFKPKNSSSDQATGQTANEPISVSEMNISNLTVRKISSLSNSHYRVYSMALSNENVGHFGVYKNGYFNYVVIADNIDSKQVLEFIKTYIRKGLNLIPIERPRLHPIPMHLVAE